MIATVRFLTNAAAVILAPTEATGYRLRGVTIPERRRRRSLVTADDVDGDVEQQSVLDSAMYELSWLVMGTSGSQVETRRAALLAAAETKSYRLEVAVDGVTTTWNARAADSTTIFDPEHLQRALRPVILRVPVQPTPL